MTQIDLEPDETVDARGAACPGPLMDLIGKMRNVETGTLVLLLSDNEQSLVDVPEWAQEAGNMLHEVQEGEQYHEFYVEKT